MRFAPACAVVLMCVLARAAEIPAAEKIRLAALLPAEKSGRPARYYTDDLYRYLDGGADAYLARGMVAMVHRELTVRGADATVDIFDMGSAANAKAQFAAERSPESPAVAFGDGGYLSGEVLNFFADRYYVKLSVFADGTKPEPVLRELAGEVAAKIARARGAGRPAK